MLPEESQSAPTAIKPLKDIERQYIIDVLQKFGGNKSKAASALKIDRVTLYNKIKEYNIATLHTSASPTFQ